ncbi:hypothetical protein [Variovorax sp. UC74_104]|uniref:hypothetical protein n=1 Tax=Variovorax sp. UC74_104 TaxID=3374555 RepID=UPI0037581BCD
MKWRAACHRRGSICTMKAPREKAASPSIGRGSFCGSLPAYDSATRRIWSSSALCTRLP